MMMNAYGVDGLSVVVVRGQETVLARGFGVQADGTPFTADTPVGAYSATKALSSFVYASLVEDGRIDLDARLGGLLDDAPDAWAEIPFWRLLNHTSGIPMIVNRPEFEALAANPTSSNADVYEIVRQLPLDYAPGEASRYRQSGYAIAEMILEDRLGATWLELVAEHLTSPAGAAATAHAHVASGARTTPLLASAGWYETTADDMAAIFKALNAGAVVDPAFLEDVLFQDRYDFDGYSLGSILETIDGVRTVGHQGGGARATIRYVPSRGVGVAVFTDDRENNDLAIHLAELFVREAALGQEPERPVAVALFSMRSAPAEDVVAFYQAESRRSGAPFDFARGEWALNRLGYMLLQEGRMDDAVTVFELNAREHPQSANVHDSLGEGYLERGDLDAALRSYRRVLELAPRSRNAPRMIEQIEAMRDGEP
ncbi:MAG: serine hydrolase [Bacteroidota bacterium]